MNSFVEARAVRVGDREAYQFALASVEAAVSRVWVSLFIHDLRPQRDVEGLVLELTNSLVQRHRAGVDVRVLLTGTASAADIFTANYTSGLLMRAKGLPHRRIFRSPDGERVGSHAKFYICDNVAVLGSQNWTDDGFRLNTEDSVALSGQPVTLLSEEFARLWRSGKRMPAHETD